MTNIAVETFILGPLETNCYLLTSGKDAIVIDCAPEPFPLLEAIKTRNLNVTAIYLTHMHLDHIGGVGELQQLTGAEVFGNIEDMYLNEVSFSYGGSKEFPQLHDFKATDLKPGKQFIFDQPMMVLDTPGHTRGSLSYFFPALNCVFVGDVIFMIAVGRTDFPGGDSETLLNSIRNRIFILPDETQIHSGHGPMTTVIHEKRNNPFFT
ncbi:MBL fold metallo-hydrolase [Desulfovibrio gilichinskyi]|uniref:Glyoxylase, beta-lactamase superfamily II n=1 Tax=Desulfovibrio gilichinskyi TaxID=1519643 RepID=A0A1X7DP23_9BACT|nr:MBL fold metallo-hydrolase [Desulfovibrio gilichinskyi]SMF18649.1 Glyoxylase, beta-lactamase superfamily II [Desulfovibrio gilichinskyi]